MFLFHNFKFLLKLQNLLLKPWNLSLIFLTDTWSVHSIFFLACPALIKRISLWFFSWWVPWMSWMWFFWFHWMLFWVYNKRSLFLLWYKLTLWNIYSTFLWSLWLFQKLTILFLRLIIFFHKISLYMFFFWRCNYSLKFLFKRGWNLWLFPKICSLTSSHTYRRLLRWHILILILQG